MHLRRTTIRRAALRVVTAAGMAAAITFTAACSGGSDNSWKSGEAAAPSPSPAGPIAAASITAPAADAKDVPASAEIAFSTEQATSSTVELKDAAGKVIKGGLRADGKTWVPQGSLAYGTTYTATVTATGSDGKEATATSTFTTMAKPGNTIRVSSNIGDGNVVGVGMPLVLRFGREIPTSVRDDVERRLWVTTSPAQEGSWHWFSGTELHYRPKAFWQAGTKMDFRIGIGGLPLGGNWYGRADLTVDASVRTDPLLMTVDNKTKKMTVTYKGQVAKTLPVSLGAQRTPSSSGTMVVMERLRNTIFDTSDAPDPRDRYVTPIEFAQRLTWGGEFIHAAPWSVRDQGVRNVSHGCVNVSMANAEWLFNHNKVGDPITIKGTERTLQKGNGWTDWSIPWDQYVKGAALTPAEASANTPPSATPNNG